MSIILGSSSPRRREILGYFGVPFEQASPEFDEEAVPFEGDPIHHARVLAEGKASSLADQYPQAVILAADTLVYKDGQLHHKPKTDAEGQATLGRLAGARHTVITAVTGRFGNQVKTEATQTQVQLANLTPEQIRRYHQVLHCGDKAGAYMLQQGGGLIVEAIKGCYYNVVGLPIRATHTVLKHFGIDLWDYLRPLSS